MFAPNNPTRHPRQPTRHPGRAAAGHHATRPQQQRQQATGKTLVRVADAATNATAATVRGYIPYCAPVKLAQAADLTGNGLAEYALLARNPDTGQVTAEIRDDSGGISRMWFSSECIPLDLATIADINANGARELVMLGRCGAESKLQAVVKEARTGETLNRISF